MSDTKLNSAPEDGISAVRFAPNSSQFLLVSSWDCTVRLYDVNDNFMRMKYMHSTPVLDCCFQVRVGHLLQILKKLGIMLVVMTNDTVIRLCM